MVKQPFILEIPKRSRCCHKGQEPFQPGTDYYSTLIEDPDGLLRRDYCPTCWDEQTRSVALKQAKSIWKSQVPAKAVNPLEGLNREEKALALFKEAVAAKTPEMEAEAFILALYLARKKQIAFRDELQKENEHLYLYEELATEEIICVKKVDFPKTMVDRVQQNLAAKLKG
jgi:hypothetical protein